MGVRFEITDPRHCRVKCSDEAWETHVLSRHPDMKGWEERARGAIQNPDYGIFQDPDFQERNIYYRRIRRANPLYLKVIVSFNRLNEGELITAYKVSSIKDGEKLLWPSNEI
jgi:hypothetical protein